MANVLIADDSVVMRTILRYLLESLGHTVVGEAGDGAEALRLLVTMRPQVVALDMSMPGTDSLQVLREINETMPDVPVFVIVDTRVAGTGEPARPDGAVGVLLKPFTHGQVTGELGRVGI